MKTLFSTAISSVANCRPSIGERAIAMLHGREQYVFSFRLLTQLSTESLSTLAKSAVCALLCPSSSIHNGFGLNLQGWSTGDRFSDSGVFNKGTLPILTFGIQTPINQVLDHTNPLSGRRRRQPDLT